MSKVPTHLNTFKVGSTLLGLYNVMSDAIEGGMGQVFHVSHKVWGDELAIKLPQESYFRTEEQKLSFMNECELWINLGLHPHIVSCYYVREIGGIPSIFAEWMDGGSLCDAIYSASLYEGDDISVLNRILDVSLQSARGLSYAHKQGLIHQDVKPTNILLSLSGDVKVTDFGISKALLSQATTNRSDYGTTEYISPEQSKCRSITQQTDIWSWAVSVLEMFLGDRPWLSGVAAGLYCEDYFSANARVSIPEEMKDLLRFCFKENAADRPEDFLVIEEILLRIFKSKTGKSYHRLSPKAAPNTADSLNNRALSYIDIDKPEEAVRYWERALSIMPNHTDSLYNQSIYLWKSGLIDDIEALRKVNARRTEKTDFLLAKIHLSRGDAEVAIKCLESARGTLDDVIGVERAMVAAYEMIRYGKDGKLLRIFEEKEKKSGEKSKMPIESVCISPDGNLALSSGYDNSMALWDIATGQRLRTFSGHEKAVCSVCFSPNLKIALSGSEDASIRLWDIDTGKCLHTFLGHRKCISSISISPDGKLMLSGSYDGTIKLWKASTGECIRMYRVNKRVNSVCFSPDGRSFLSGSDDSSVKMWVLSTGKPRRVFEGHKLSVLSVSYSPDGKTVLTCSEDCTAKLWSATTGKLIRSFAGHQASVNSICYSPNGRTALSGSKDGTIKLWCLETGQCFRTYEINVEGFARQVESVCFGTSGNTVLSINRDSAVRLWSIPDVSNCEMVLSKISDTNTTLNNADRFSTLVNSVRSLLEQGNVSGALTAYTQLKTNQLHGSISDYLDVKEMIARYCVLHSTKSISRIDVLAPNAISGCFSPNGQMVLTGDKQGVMKLWNLKTLSCIRVEKGKPLHVSFVCFNPNGSLALSCDYEGDVRLWNTVTWQCEIKLDRQHRVDSACFSPDGQVVLTGGSDGSIKMWSIAQKKYVNSLKAHNKSVTSISFSPDGQMILSGSKDCSVKTLDYNTGSCVNTLTGHRNTISTACFNPEGNRIITGSKDKTIMLWDAVSGQYIKTVSVHDHGIASVCFSPNGRLLLVVDTGVSLSLWDTDTYENVYSLHSKTSENPAACFSPNGLWVLLTDHDGISLLDLSYYFSFPGWSQWNDGALPYLESFITLRRDYTDEDFLSFISTLQNRGFGWLRPDGVKAKLKELCTKKDKIKQHSGTHVMSADNSRLCTICSSVLFDVPATQDICTDCNQRLKKIVKQAQRIKDDNDILAGYHRLSLLGEGGMSRVWLIEDKDSNQQLAMKMMLLKNAIDEKRRKAFLREAMLSTQLSHRNIVRHYECGQYGNELFLVMEYCDGGSLDDYISKNSGKLCIDIATHIILQILDGLNYAHNLCIPSQLENGETVEVTGIVHRDIKPGNILLIDNKKFPTCKISDFGLAKAFETAGLSGYTRTGSKSGTPEFMPRQQIINFKGAKPSVDIWAAAASYYFMLTGMYPKEFSRRQRDYTTILFTDATPIRRRNVDIPEKLAEVIDYALVETPEIGIQSAAELISMIESAF